MDLDTSEYGRRRRVISNDFFRNDMWFGATLGAVSDGKILIGAPRWSVPYRNKHLLMNGVVYVHKQDREWPLYTLKEQNRQAFMTDGTRKEYGEYGTHLNFYAYGEAGISLKVTENDTAIVGAPGLLQWTGGIVNFKFNPNEDSTFFSKHPITNPYFTEDLKPDDYFGYSVESGIFDSSGIVLYVGGAPRSGNGYGKVLIFEPAIREQEPLRVRAKVTGPQLGAYFGSTLCCMDVDGDGISELLVGAPNYVTKKDGLPYDQGAVFVYKSIKQNSGFYFEHNGFVLGSGKNGGRFGSSIAQLGDIDGDGFKDVAVGAPWEDDGVVYIYRGDENGLRSEYTQRITVVGAKGFGWSIAKGYDVDHNNCSDLAIGAHSSETAYLYRCIPTMTVYASIKVPDAMNLPQNATGFTALFCVTSPPMPMWPHVKLGLKARIVIDPEQSRARISGNSEYKLVIKPGNINCDEQTVEVKPTADLSRPISMKLELESDEILHTNGKVFLTDAARLSEESTMHSSFLIQLIRDCGEDMICTPWLEMSFEPFEDNYVPGAGKELGVTLSVLNTEEPAYGARVNLSLPLSPKRLPSDCILEELNLTCNLPSPFLRGEEIEWNIEFEYNIQDSNDTLLHIKAVLEDPLYYRNISDENEMEVTIDVTPEATFSVSGKPFPNATVVVTRDQLNKAENILLTHYYEITNHGPSDWYHLESSIYLPKVENTSTALKDCEALLNELHCDWNIMANSSKLVTLQLFYDLNQYGNTLRENSTYNFTTTVILNIKGREYNASITTKLVLEPAPPLWPLIVGLIAGLLVLAIIILILYKYGFFSRQQRERLKELKEQKENSSPNEEQGSSTSPPSLADESTLELLGDDSDG